MNTSQQDNILKIDKKTQKFTTILYIRHTINKKNHQSTKKINQLTKDSRNENSNISYFQYQHLHTKEVKKKEISFKIEDKSTDIRLRIQEKSNFISIPG